LWGSGVAAKKQDVKAAPKRKAAKKPLDKRVLWRMALWAVTAGCALMLAVLTSRTEAGAERLAYVIASLRGQPAPPPFDAEVETRKLATSLGALSAENDRLRSRLSAVERHEHQIEDVTGSLTKQIEAVKAEAEAPRPADTAPVTTTPAVTGSAPVPSPPAAALPGAVPTSAPPVGVQPPSPAKPADPGSSSSAAPKQFGVDVGSALSIQALRARWAEIHAAHPHLFQGLTATAVTRGIPQSDHSELRLVLGPLANSDAAARLCTSLAPYRISCQPIGFDGQHVALQ
jgi:hypothetical protein